MNPEDKVLLEAFVYVMLIVSSPFIYKVVYVISLAFWRLIFPIDTIEITVVRDGVEREEKVSIKNDKQLLDAVLHSKRRSHP